MWKFLVGMFKLLIASLMAGAALNALDISAADMLAEVGMTPERLMTATQSGIDWAVPNIMLGAMIIVPIWLVVFLLRPPRG